MVSTVANCWKGSRPVGNENWAKFKQAFQQNADIVLGAGANVKPKNRKELRDLLRSDVEFAKVRRLVFGDWRNR